MLSPSDTFPDLWIEDGTTARSVLRDLAERMSPEQRMRVIDSDPEDRGDWVFVDWCSCLAGHVFGIEERDKDEYVSCLGEEMFGHGAGQAANILSAIHSAIECERLDSIGYNPSDEDIRKAKAEAIRDMQRIVLSVHVLEKEGESGRVVDSERVRGVETSSLHSVRLTSNKYTVMT